MRVESFRVQLVVSDDAALVARLRAGDERAFAQLVDRYHGEVYHLALRSVRVREDAEDLAQEAFLRAYRAIDQYDPTRPFGAWIYVITARLCIDFHRRRKVRPVSLTRPEEGSAAEEHEWELPDPGRGPEEDLARDELSRRLGELVDRLPEDYRLAILLRHAQDLSYEEIAEALDAPIGTIKARIHRARAQLRAWLEGTELDPEAAAPRPESEKTPPPAHPKPPSLRKRKR